jgi:hypothetical protein
MSRTAPSLILSFLPFFCYCMYHIKVCHQGGKSQMISLFILFAIFILFYINKMTNSLCLQKEIPEEKQPKVFRTINILITILLVSSFVELLFA